MRSLFYNWGVPFYPRMRYILLPILIEKAKSFAPIRRLMRSGGYDRQHSESFAPYNVQIRTAEPGENRPRVLHVIQNFLLGGTSRLIVDLIENLSDEFEQCIISEFSPEPPHFLNIPITHFKGNEITERLKAEVARFNPDIVHIHYWENDWYNAVLEELADSDARFVENVNVPIAPLRHPRIDKYVYVSETIEREFASPGDPTTVIYPGSDFDLFATDAPFPPGPPVVGMVYRLSLPKLSAASIDVFIEVLRRNAEARALIVGGGLFLDYYKWRVRQAGLCDRFEFTGFRSYTDLPALYARMSMFIAPVQVESFGHVSPLAMGMGKVVAGYDIGAIPEIVGNPDLVAPAGDVPALADLAAGLLARPDEMRRLGQAARARALERFSTAAMLRDYRALYHELLAQTDGAG